MNISEFCIRRPVATVLMSLALVVAGLAAYRLLPVAALPSAEFPVINVSAQLPGASPDTMATSVATPLIKQFATIAGIDTISSTSADGSTSISLQFSLDRDIDAAAADVQSAIARVQKQLPPEMTNPPSYRKFNPADAPVLLVALHSPTEKLSNLDAFAEQVISPSLSTLEGVAQVQVFGSQKYAVRIEIDPVALTARGIGMDEVQTALGNANSNTPMGSLQNSEQLLTVQANTQLENARQFSNLIIATRNGHPVRLGDVARVIDSVENLRTASWFDDSRSLVLAVYRQPDANTVKVVDRVQAKLKDLEAQLPGSVSIGTLNDRSVSVRDAVNDVEMTLGVTIVLVLMVIFVFLRRLTATIIPGVAVPISLIATLAVMYVFGYSIDNISLLGLTLSVGLVVDDAIVMLENIVRHMEEDGVSAWTAALRGSREIGFTIVSMSFSLVAVFIPVLLMGGVIGRVFNEFAVVVTVAIVASGFVSLTLTPMMAARLLRDGDAHAGKAKAKTGRKSLLERGFDLMHNGYAAGLRASLRHQPFILLVFAASCAATVYMVTTIPKGFFPQEDIGLLQVQTQARQDISFEAMANLQAEVAQVFKASPYVTHVASTIGGSYHASGLNAGRLYIQLKPKDQRPPLEKVISDLRAQTAKIVGVSTFITPTQNLRIGGHSSRSQYQVVLQALDKKELYTWANKLAGAMRADKEFLDVDSDLENNGLQASLIIDRDKAESLGVDADTLRSSLYSGFGERQVATIYTSSDNFPVIMDLDPRYGWTADRLDLIRVRARTTGKLVPLGAFAHVERTAGPVTVSQLGQLRAVTLSFNLPEGEALGQAVTHLDQVKAQIGMPETVSTALAGTAKAFQDSLNNQGLLILGAIVTIYIVLGMLYESYIHPITILAGLPSAVVGAVGALELFGLDLSVIAIIGVLMLIGIVKKNAIMMIDVALDLRRKGLAPPVAIYRASLMRFRPIMMTTFAALFGALPIAMGIGASAELRQPLGVAVVGGLIVSQVLTLFVTPVVYLLMDRFEPRPYTPPEEAKTTALPPAVQPAE